MFVCLCKPTLMSASAGCAFVCYSGGRNIVVMGSSFDLIQTAIMRVGGDGVTAFEV